jgi:hypothetical protein
MSSITALATALVAGDFDEQFAVNNLLGDRAARGAAARPGGRGARYAPQT